jgi:hypothetical protein
MSYRFRLNRVKSLLILDLGRRWGSLGSGKGGTRWNSRNCRPNLLQKLQLDYMVVGVEHKIDNKANILSICRRRSHLLAPKVKGNNIEADRMSTHRKRKKKNRSHEKG